jgi:hypothetical protein
MPVAEVEQQLLNGAYNVGHAITTRQLDVDFDTDHKGALASFHYFLPRTPYRIGRASKPDSHWIFNFAEDYFDRANEFKHIVSFLARNFKIQGKPVSIEYRYRTHKDNEFNCRLPAENPYVFAPGSIHPSGELITWGPGLNTSLTATNYDIAYIFKQTALAIIASLIVPYWTAGARQYMSMALSGTLQRMSMVRGPEDEPCGVHFTDLDFETLVKGICHLAGDDEIGPRLQTFKQTWRKAENPDTKTTGATSLKRYLGDDKEYILNTMFMLISGIDGDANVQAIYEQFCLYRGTGFIIDTSRIDNRLTWIMRKDGFTNSYASQWVTWLGKRTKLAKFVYESGVLDTVDGVDYIAPEKMTLEHYTTDREREYVEVKGATFLNIFKPYDTAPSLEPVTDKDVAPFLDYIKDVFGDTPEKYNYLMGWLANLIQSPGAKPHTYPIIVGEQGTGKSFLFEKFIRPILGNQASVTTEDLEGLLSNYNSLIEGRTLVVFEEAINHNRREIASRLKQLVTGDRMVLRKKYEPEREINSFIRCVFLSNDEEQAVAIDATIGERRACVLKVSDVHSKDRTYFGNLAAWAKDHLGDVHRYLLDYKYDVEVINTAIANEEKAGMQAASMLFEAPEVFWIMERLEAGFPLDPLKPREWWQAFKHEDIEHLTDNVSVDNSTWPDRISEAALREDFQHWAYKNGFSSRNLAGKVKKKVRGVFPYLRGTGRILYNVMIDHKPTTINPVLMQFPSRKEIIEHLNIKYSHVLSAELKADTLDETHSVDLRTKGARI